MQQTNLFDLLEVANAGTETGVFSMFEFIAPPKPEVWPPPPPDPHPYVVGNLVTVRRLPDRWEVVRDDATGRKYFFHTACDCLAEHGHCIMCGMIEPDIN